MEWAYFVLNGALKLRIAGHDYVDKENNMALLRSGVKHVAIPQGKALADAGWINL